MKKANGLGFNIGIPTLLEYGGLAESAAMCAGLGLDFLELNMNLPYCMPEHLGVENALKLQEVYGIFFTLHFPEKIDFASFSSTVRESALKLFKETCAYAAEANIKLINVHIDEGVYFTMPTEKIWLYEKYNTDFIANISDTFNKMAKIAKNKKILLCVENTVFPSFFEPIFTELSGIKNINFTWDIGHDAQSSYRFSRFVNKNKIKLTHMHIHDFDGISSHQSLFSGVLDIEKAFETARTNNITAVVEVKTESELVTSINKARNKGVI